MKFSSDLANFARKTGISMDKVVRKISLDLMRDLVMGTPVDTGHARSNWFVGTNRDGGIDKAMAKNGSPSFARAAQFATALRAGGVFYITNNLPYIMRLEYGHSKVQAPLGWVRSTVANWQKTVDRVVREVAV